MCVCDCVCVGAIKVILQYSLQYSLAIAVVESYRSLALPGWHLSNR